MRTELTFYPSTGTPIELSFDEAKELYRELSKIFSKDDLSKYETAKVAIPAK